MKFDPYRPSTYTPFIRRFTDERAKDLADTTELSRRVTSAHYASRWAQENALSVLSADIADLVGDSCELPDNKAVLSAFSTCQNSILALEKTIFDTPHVDFDSAVLSLKEHVDVRRFLRAQEHFLANEGKVIHLLILTVGTTFAGISDHLSPIPDASHAVTVPLHTFVPNLKEMVDKIIGTLCKDELADVGLFAYLQNAFYENVCAASGIAPYEGSKKRMVSAIDSSLPADKLLSTYLRNTPFLDLFNTAVPLQIPESVRFEHCWMVGGTGHGKTQTLQYLISQDLELVAEGKASVIVIDSQSDMIKTLAGLRDFGAGGQLDGKLCLIDPHDIDYPVCLNLFDVNLERVNQYSALDRERLINSVLEMYDFVLGSLLSAELTAKQAVIFRYMMRAMLGYEPGRSLTN